MPSLLKILISYNQISEMSFFKKVCLNQDLHSSPHIAIGDYVSFFPVTLLI